MLLFEWCLKLTLVVWIAKLSLDSFKLLGRRQVVRHQVLVLAFRGSNPCAPAMICTPKSRHEVQVFFC